MPSLGTLHPQDTQALIQHYSILGHAWDTRILRCDQEALQLTLSPWGGAIGGAEGSISAHSTQ